MTLLSYENLPYIFIGSFLLFAFKGSVSAIVNKKIILFKQPSFWVYRLVLALLFTLMMTALIFGIDSIAKLVTQR